MVELTEGGARDAVNGAAIVLAGLYFYRKLLEPAMNEGAKPAQPKTLKGAAGQIVGIGPLAPMGRFIVGFGFVFLTLSMLEGASPDLAGWFALLIAATAVLGNGVAVAEDLAGQLNAGKPKKGGAAASGRAGTLQWPASHTASP